VTDRPTRRLFFALWPPAALRRELARATRSVVRAAGGRPVPVANLHITLAFLGSVPADAVGTLKAVAGEVAAQPFDLALARVGFFPRARTLWLGPDSACLPLIQLQDGLWQVLAAAGWPRESRPFTPHLTLVRKAQAMPDGPRVKSVLWRVESFSLVESITHESGAVYQELASWPFTSA
jgi:2'-5' RNA ligase